MNQSNAEISVVAYTTPETRVIEGYDPLGPYHRIVGATTDDTPTVWDERPTGDARDAYDASGFTKLDFRAWDALAVPAEAGEHKRVRSSTLSPEDITPQDRQLAEVQFQKVLSYIHRDAPFGKLVEHITQENTTTTQAATYQEALYALELARFVTANDFQHRIACYELSLTATFFCLAKGLGIEWCLGISMQTEEPHAWIEADGIPVRGEADEVITGVYSRLLRIGTAISK